MPAKVPGPMKVMDVTHPRNVQPDATSRPGIVPSRPMVVADPMIAQSAVDVLTKSGGAEKSAGDPTELIEHTPELVIDRQAKAVSPEDEGLTTDATVEEQPKSVDPVLAGAPLVASVAKPMLDVVAPAAPAIEITEPTVATAISQDGISDDNAPMQSSIADVANPLARSQSTFEMTQSDEDDTTTEKTAEQKQAENIEKLIASRLYAVPIGRRAKRRARILLTTVFIVLLAILAADLMLDMGLIKLSGVPHTTLFSL